MNDETVREKLAEALHYASQDPEDYYQVAWEDNYGRNDLYDAADALLPIVREIAADELREAADLMPVSDDDCGYQIRNGLRPGPARWLRDRADALHGEPAS